MADPKSLSERIEDAVNEGASGAEEINRRFAELPLSVLERMGLFERTAADVRELREASIGTIYEVSRDVNHEVTKLAAELLECDRPEA